MKRFSTTPRKASSPPSSFPPPLTRRGMMEDDAEESVPEMRSVAISRSGAGAGVLDPFAMPSRPTPRFAGSGSSLPPLRKASLSAMKQQQQRPQLYRPETITKDEDVSAAGSWLPRALEICEKSLPELPPYYHDANMMNSTASIELSVSRLLTVIADHLRSQSITGSFQRRGSDNDDDDDAATCTETCIQCQTNEHLHFVIYLWRPSTVGTDEASKKNGVVVVEIQRRRGCCVQMQRCRRELISALQSGGNDVAVATDPPKKSIPLPGKKFAPPPVPSFIKQKYQNEQGGAATVARKRSRNVSGQNLHGDDYNRSGTADAAIAKCRELLTSDRLDQRQLGMEKLLSLTRVDAGMSAAGVGVQAETRIAVANAISSSEGTNGQVLRDELFRWLRRDLCRQQKLGDGTTIDHGPTEMNGMAMKVVANVLCMELSSESTPTNHAFYRGVLRVLRENISDEGIVATSDASSSSSGYCYVATMLSCLNMLAKLSGSAALSGITEDERFFSDLQRVASYGKTHDSNIEEESKQLMSIMS